MRNPKTIYVHLRHPCDDVDVWYVESMDEAKIAVQQGYISLNDLRRLSDNYEFCGHHNTVRDERTKHIIYETCLGCGLMFGRKDPSSIEVGHIDPKDLINLP